MARVCPASQNSGRKVKKINPAEVLRQFSPEYDRLTFYCNREGVGLRELSCAALGYIGPAPSSESLCTFII